MAMNARLLTSLLVFFASSASAAAFASTDHLRVVWHENPATEAIVSWSTDGPAETYLVWDDETHDAADEYEHRSSGAQNSGQYDEDAAPVFHHHTLSGLEPASEVHFRVVTEAGASRPYWFRTAPADARPFVLLYGGDSRSDSAARRAMNRRIRDLVESDPTVVAFHHGGDYIETGSSWPQWDRWLRDWQETVTSDGRVLPIIPARGNHEGDGVLYNRVFGFPGDAKSVGDWWTTRIGEDFTLIVLDSNVSQAGAQREWLDETLAELQKHRWIVPSYHRPAYPAVKTPGGALYHWVPLFEQYNVDFVLESDGHVLKRTVPIRDGQPNPNGVVYLGEGGLGVPQRTPDTDRWYLQSPGMAKAAHHVQALRVTPDAVFYAAILENGEVADTHTFRPRRRGQYEEPSVSSARLDDGRFEVQFDRAMRAKTATNAANYAFEPRLQIVDVRWDDARRVAVLKTAKPTREGYRLVVDGVVDDAGKPVPRTAFVFEGVLQARAPVAGKLATPESPTETDQIRVLPVGEPKPPQDPPLISCSQSASAGGAGLTGLLFVVMVVIRRRPQRRER
jgi:hypothetical protein